MRGATAGPTAAAGQRHSSLIENVPPEQINNFVYESPEKRLVLDFGEVNLAGDRIDAEGGVKPTAAPAAPAASSSRTSSPDSLRSSSASASRGLLSKMRRSIASTGTLTRSRRKSSNGGEITRGVRKIFHDLSAILSRVYLIYLIIPKKTTPTSQESSFLGKLMPSQFF